MTIYLYFDLYWPIEDILKTKAKLMGMASDKIPYDIRCLKAYKLDVIKVNLEQRAVRLTLPR